MLLIRMKLVVVLFLCVLTSGCMKKVYINPDAYKPNIQLTQVQRFQSKRIYMQSFTNSAQNTSLWNYYSPDSSIRYGTNQALYPSFCTATGTPSWR
jgi:hypothetical protein